MKIRLNQLSQHLQRGLAPVYLVSGDEPLQAMEAADAIRSHAREQGYSERQIMSVETGFDWSGLAAATDNLSLFAERKLIDLRMPTGKAGVAGGKALAEYAKQPAEDTLLLIQTGKLDRSAANSAWVKAADKAGVHLQVWPLSQTELIDWIATRLRQRGFKPEREAVQLLTNRVEGNLLAAAQEVEKLSLLYPQGALNVQQVLAAVADTSRYSVFDLADAALAGNTVRAVKILDGLRAEDVKPPLVLWSLADQLRQLAAMSHELARGMSMDAVLRPVWAKRQALMRKALSRQRPETWLRLLRRCAHADRVIKGQTQGKSWDELLQLAVGLSQ